MKKLKMFHADELENFERDIREVLEDVVNEKEPIEVSMARIIGIASMYYASEEDL